MTVMVIVVTIVAIIVVLKVLEEPTTIKLTVTPVPITTETKVVEVNIEPQINRNGIPTEVLMAPEVQIKLRDEPGTVNARRAAEILDKYVLKSGETFSYNTVVAPRTEANGFVYGSMPITINGKEEITEVVSSGVCRLVVGLATAVKRVGLKQIEITPHEYTPYYFATNPDQHLIDATVYMDGNIDNKFKNNKDHDIRIKCNVDKNCVLHVSFYKLIYPNN